MTAEPSLGFIISATNTKLKNNLSKALKDYNVTPDQWALLVELWKCDKITQKELSERSYKDQPTTTRMLDLLEKRKLIYRKCNPEDRRSFLIFLTPEGQNIKEPLTKLACKALAEALQGFSEQEKTQLKNLLYKIMDNLD